jgi:hypothetical protein
MKATDSEDFKVAMIKEANDHINQLHGALWEKQDVWEYPLLANDGYD